jgi:hypothetical protein
MKYYLHDSNSFNDEKITLLHINYGYEALGLFYTIIEKLAAQEKPILEKVLISQLKIGKKLKKQLKFMYEIEILSINNGEVFSETLLNFSKKYQIKKEKNTKRVAEWRKNQEIKKDVTRYESVSNTSKVNKSKVNKIKEYKENFSKQCFEFLSLYSKDMILDFVSYWTELNKSKTKMKFELQQTFEIQRRLSTWNKNNFNKDISKPTLTINA